MRKGMFLAGVVALMAVVMVMAVTLPGCKKEAGEKKTYTVITLNPGKLLIGNDTTYAPMEYMEAGTPVGFDIDLAKEIASRLGLELQIITTNWDGIIPGLKTDKYDVIMSAMTITEKRSQEIDFSDPYFDADQSLAVKSGSSIKSTDDLKGKVVGVQIDTTGQEWAEKNLTGLKELRKYETIIAAFEDLKLGRVDAIINDFPVNNWYSKDGKTEVVQIIKTEERYGIGIKKGNDQLREAINQVLADIKADGTYATIYESWFGKKPE